MAQFHYKLEQPAPVAQNFLRQWLAKQPGKPQPPKVDWYGREQFVCLTVPEVHQQIMATLWLTTSQDEFKRHGLIPLTVSSPFVVAYTVKKTSADEK